MAFHKLPRASRCDCAPRVRSAAARPMRNGPQRLEISSIAFALREDRTLTAKLAARCDAHESWLELNALGFCVTAGDLGENITTRHVHLAGLDAGTVLELGSRAHLQITGLRTRGSEARGHGGGRCKRHGRCR